MTAAAAAAAPRASLVIFGISNILSDLFDCALANGLQLGKVVEHHAEVLDERSLSLAQRLQALSQHCTPPQVQTLAQFAPGAEEVYLLGPTTPAREQLALELTQRFGLRFTTLIHPTAYVSPLATLGQGVFVGANSVVGPGAVLEDHVFVNRGVTIGHDTRIGAYSRVQPGANVGGLSNIGCRVTVAIGATTLERLVIGDDAFVGAGAVAVGDVAAGALVVGVPAKFKRQVV
ncbi:acetyltransferase [Duganella sp. Dugasp56]|uniref:acetyltransferase n=1 Tax=Duganella sp. Dugasp56 TaxID=3243046 RepID=UPI0039AFB09B